MTCLSANGPFQDPDASLRILYWNAGGLNSSKFLEFKRSVSYSDVDIYFIVEAGAATDHIQFYNMTNYVTYTLNRARQIASGIITGIKKDLRAKFEVIHEMQNGNKAEIIFVQVWKGRKRFSVVNLYNPPGNILPTLPIEATLQPNSIIVGDFNSPSTRWGYSSTTRAGERVEEMIDDNLLEVIETPPTFLSYSGSTSRPDLVIVDPSIARKTKAKLLDDAAGCGHRSILVESMIRKPTRTRSRAPRWNFSKANWKKYRKLTDDALTKKIDWKSLESAVQSLNKTVLECALCCIPRGQVKVYRPFWTSKLSRLKQTRNLARKKAERTQTISDSIALRKAQAQLQKEIKYSKRETFKNFLSTLDFRKDGSKAHRFISCLNSDLAPKGQEPFQKGNKSFTDPRDIANLLCKHYTNISRVDRPRSIFRSLSRIPLQSCPTQSDIQICFDNFSIAELDHALSFTKKKKAAGVDQIFPEMLINLGQKAKLVLLKIINLSWTSHVPQHWRKGEIVPIQKKGKPANEANSYRPVALTSACSKVMERMVVRRLDEYLDSHDIIDEAQAGFRPKRNTMDQVVYFSQCVKDGFHRKMSTLAVLIDLKNAYDTVWREMLIHKLAASGITGNLFKWVKSFLAERLIRVKFGGSTSKFRTQRQGLPQGAVISCSLFNLMVNDVLDAVRSVYGVQALLYADDLIVWATGSNIKSLEEALNKTLARLLLWTETNAMCVNVSKTTYQLFTLKKRSPEILLHYGRNELAESNISKYLGVSIDSKMTWKAHIEDTANRALKRARLLKRLTATTWGANQDVLNMAYRTYIRPILEYGSEATITASTTTTRIIQKTQNSAMRVITGAPKSTPIAAMEAQLQLEPMQMRREKMTLCFWERYKRTYSHRWANYKEATVRLKTQKTPLTAYKELLEKYNIDPGIPAPYADRYKLCHQFPKANCTLLNHSRSKGESNPSELRTAAIETINSAYPPNQWLHVYTDGSSLPDTGKTGAGFYCSLFQGSLAVGTNQSNFDGEIAAILAATEQLEQIEPPSQAVLLVDSMAAIMAVTNNKMTDCNATIICRQNLEQLLVKGWRIELQWIPSHVDIRGNEIADSLAKRGTTLPQPSVPTTLTSIKAQINSALQQRSKNYLEEASSGKSWAKLVTNGPINKFLPRKEGVALFRLATGHDYLAAHLHRIHVLPSSVCTLCNNGDMTAEHLHTCTALDHSIPDESEDERIIRLYWSARRQMAQQPRVGVG